ncbi:hypothetical protein [Xanthomonas albilineans]|uniref:hypothetical protein n=1 Tax=Xanthomonas albilineans TaxID=29447 RepID=UPI0005F3312A|nr:hypothetical protein [Xanthomonas albilineans]
MANALSDFLSSYQAGNAITQQQHDQRQQNQLTQLAPQIISGNPQAYAQAAAINPQVAQQYQQGNDEIAKRARGAAKFLQSALQSGNQQQIMAARQTVKPFMDTLKPGSSYPMDLDPQQEMAGIQGFLAQTAYLDPDLKAGTPTGFREFQMKAAAAGLQPGTPEYQNAAKIALGQEGRASNAGFTQVKFTGPDGRERIGVMNGRSGKIDLPDGTSFDPRTGSTAPTQQSMDMQPPGPGLYNTPNGPVRIHSDLTPEEWKLVQEDTANNGAKDNYQLPGRDVSPQQFQNAGNIFVGRAPEEQAAATEAAKQQAQVNYLPTIEGIKTDAALNTARGKAQIKNDADRANQARNNSTAYNVYEQGMGGLINTMGKTDTGPVSGRLPALTANQQSAEGSVAAMAPVMKQMFRQAGEGVFTDRDQDTLMAMLPTRADLPEARASKIADVDNIVRAKLQMPPPQQARNPKTGQVLYLRLGQWMPK